jgi:hypothetical protein
MLGRRPMIIFRQPSAFKRTPGIADIDLAVIHISDFPTLGEPDATP